MQNISSKSSLGKKSFNQKYVTDHNKLLLVKIETILQQASTTLPYIEFCEYFSNIVKSIIQKYESESTDSAYINSLKRSIAKYNINIQLEVRLMLLQVKSQLHIFPQQSLSILIKSKHMIIDTEYEYMLSKVFILEAKIYHHLHRKDLQAKSLLKSIQFAQNFVLQYLNDKQDNRKQITQNIVIAYFELYKLKRQNDHKEAEQFIQKACRSTQKNYGHQSQVAQLLNLVYKDHKNIGKGLQKYNFSIKSPRKAFTDIMKNEVKKDLIVYGFYSWEDNKIFVQLIKNNHDDSIILSEAEYVIKLDMGKIEYLRNGQWIRISQGQVQILQEQVLKLIEIKQQKSVTTKIGIKTISRQDIIKRDNLSSSSEDPSFIEKEDFNFIRKLGRAQSAKRQNN